jgi:uncharacterized protein YecE (DUF72 family)
MHYRIGTSGYSYKEWKGSFYPEKFSDKKMLPYYAERFSTVEVNYTFRTIPSEATVQKWIAETPDTFQFVCKAPQAITHYKRLQGAEDEVTRFFAALAPLGKRQGPVLFQLPPNLKKDLPRLDAFLRLVDGHRAAVEFRHASWLDDEVFACLRAHSCALCAADGEGLPATSLVSTASFGYLRLRGDDYTDENLKAWVTRFKEHDWQELYVFFRHEDTAAGPQLAARLLKLLGVRTIPFCVSS